MKDTWDHRIQRAERLASERIGSSELLSFYAVLLRSQKKTYEHLQARKNWRPSGDLAQDLPMLRPVFPNLLHAVEANGPDMLVSQAKRLLEASESDLDEMFIEHWRWPSDMHFFAKAFLQPYASWLREIGVAPADRNLKSGENRCPFCCGKPQVSIHQIKETSSESGGRDLVCAMCLMTWPFRRVVCAACGEENPARMGYYHSSEFDYVRVEACDTCKHYIKAVDLTRFGYAVPLVDDVAAAPLDLWAREHGYTKIELNLIGI